MAAAGFGGYVLAGGRSSRMGVNKAFLMLDRQPLILRALDAVLEAAGSAVVVGDPELYSAMGFQVVPDTYADAGPLAGIHAALTHSRFNWNLIVACDMPGLRAEYLAGLLAETEGLREADVLLPEAGERAQPLCAVYHRSALGAIEKALQDGQLKIMQAIGALRIGRLPAQDEELFVNVNTPDDWRAAVRH